MSINQGRVHAPAFRQGLEWLNTPRPLTLSELRGKLVLLEFWTSGCINCHHNIPELHRLHERFPNELVIISVHSGKFSSEQVTANIRETAARLGIDHPIINDAGLQMWDDYTAKGWPTVTLIDPRGLIVFEQSGEFVAEELVPVIEQVIAESEAAGTLTRQPLDLGATAPAEPAHVLSYPGKLLVAPNERDGTTRLYIADTGNHRIIELELATDLRSANVTRVFGNGTAALRDGRGKEAAFHHPHGMSIGEHAGGRVLYVADTDNHAIRAIDLQTGAVRTVAGTGTKAHGRFALGAPTATSLRSPWAVLAVEDVLFIAMAGSHQIWALIDEQQLGLFAGNGYEALADGPRNEAAFNQPSDLAQGIGYMFVADAEASAIRAISLDAQSEVSTMIGEDLFVWGDVDGTADEARLQHPVGLDYNERMLYIADTYNNKIKRLDAGTGRVTTLVGSGQAGHADGTFAEAQLFAPEGVVVVKAPGSGKGATNGSQRGTILLIADTNNHLVRVAYLASRTLHTLRLTGLERLANRPPRVLPTATLSPVTVGPGRAHFAFEIVPPAGYKLNPETPITLREDDGGDTHTFAPGEQPTLDATLDADADATLNLTGYYCDAGDEALCLIHDMRLVLPIRVAADGPSEAQVRYAIPQTPRHAQA